ncbi:MAG TPA: DUF6188 family protein [Pseudonocardiaceae bacterium]|nr:DUF6188 family protein [Pseudonocardiaceae bacterium]
MAMVEHGDRWSLSVADPEIIRLCFDYAVSLDIGLPESGVNVRIEQRLTLRRPGSDEVILTPGRDGVGLAPILGLFGLTVERLDAFKDGHLEVDLNDGTTLRVPSHDRYEAWIVAGSDHEMIISPPGGDPVG